MSAPYRNIQEAIEETCDEWQGTTLDLLFYLQDMEDILDKRIRETEKKFEQED